MPVHIEQDDCHPAEGQRDFTLSRDYPKIRRALRIAGYVLSLDAVQGMVSSMGLHIPITGDIGVGLLIVGDG